MWRVIRDSKNYLAAALRSRRFIGAWIRSPFAVGAVMPSSRALARAMVAQLHPEHPGVIIELGAGTGVMTQALLQTGVSPDRLLIVERDAKLANFLSAQFPHLNIVCADAVRLDEVVASLNICEAGAIISSLPLLSMPRHARHAAERHMAALIGATGRIVQFTYGPKSPISRHTLHKYHLYAKRVATIMANVPPAHVWVYERKTH